MEREISPEDGLTVDTASAEEAGGEIPPAIRLVLGFELGDTWRKDLIELKKRKTCVVPAPIDEGVLFHKLGTLDPEERALNTLLFVYQEKLALIEEKNACLHPEALLSNPEYVTLLHRYEAVYAVFWNGLGERFLCQRIVYGFLPIVIREDMKVWFTKFCTKKSVFDNLAADEFLEQMAKCGLAGGAGKTDGTAAAVKEKTDDYKGYA